MENNREYQQREWKSFINQKHRYFDTVKEFSDSLEQMDILEQIEWIENGSYGAGACFALQNTINRLTPRMNKDAAIGSIILHAFYGKPFKYWNKLSRVAQDNMNKSIENWMEKERNFTQILEA